MARLDELFVRSARGDSAAFAALYEETAARAYGLSLRVLHDRRLAEDAVQEAYLSMWQQAARFDPRKGSSLGWIFMIVHRVAIDHVRAVGRRAARDDRHVREQWGGGSVSDPTHDQAWASIEARTVRDAMGDLSARQSEALRLAYLDGNTFAQVADLLGIPLGTAKSRIRDGLVRLKKSDALQVMQASGNVPSRRAVAGA